MPVYCRGWVFGSQQFHQIAQRGFLSRCARVLWFLIVGSHTADIANADTVGVLSGAVCAHYLNVAPGVYAAVAVDNIVVAYPVPALLPVPAVYIFHCVVAALRGRATVYYNLCNLSHNTNIRFVVLGFRSFYVHIVLMLFRLSA